MNRPPYPLTTPSRLDDAARAGWLYYVAGNTQDEIARKLGVSRQSAQRLVALAVAERLVTVRLDHPIGRCMDLGEALKGRWGLALAEVAPSDPAAPGLLAGVAAAAAALIERVLASEEPRTVALGTGRTLREAVESVARMAAPRHRIVSLLGNMTADGRATPYNAVVRLADRVGAPHWPNPLPVLANDAAEVAALHAQEAVRRTVELCRAADLTLVGVGQLGAAAPIVVDGFMDRVEAERLAAAGAAGEITSWVYDARGRVMDCAHNRRVASVPLPGPRGGAGARPFVAVAAGEAKLIALRAALEGRLVNGIVTTEALAERLLGP